MLKPDSQHPSRFIVVRKTGYQSPYSARMLWAASRGRALDVGKPKDIRPAYVLLCGFYFEVPTWVLSSVFRLISNYQTFDGRVIR